MNDDNALQDYIINDEEPDINRKTENEKSSLMKKMIITLIIIILIFIALIIIIILLSNSNEGKIKCRYNISDKLNDVQIINKDFKKNSNIDIIINGKKRIKFADRINFDEAGINVITFYFKNDINLDNMFKNISSLISVEMEGKGNLKITSMISTFENCNNFEYFSISGFSGSELKSMKKLFVLIEPWRIRKF